MCWFRILAAASGALCGVVLATYPASAVAPDQLQSKIERTARDGRPVRLAPDEAGIREFYTQRGYRPLWFDEGRLSVRGEALLAALSKAGEHGLEPALYGMPGLEQRVRAAAGDAQAAAELALTRMFLAYAADITAGVIPNPQNRSLREAARAEAGKLLARTADAEDLSAFLANLPSDARRYNAVKAALAQYRQIAQEGGWPAVSRGPALKPGMRGRRVAELKRRLTVTGELKDADSGDVFDPALIEAVKSFQRRHGLVDDGLVGAETLAQLNVPVAARIEQIALNLERRRWLAGRLDTRYVYLNIADNALKVVENGKTIHVARVIVGKPYQQTPILSATITKIELNPYWNVPRSIAADELLPIIRSNPSYVAANDYLLLTRMGDNASAADAASVNWAVIGPDNLPFFIRQKPGPKNALGTILFVMPNPHNVFLHDTPSRQLFDRGARFFSHGCMRVEDPMRLALLLLGDQDEGSWNEARAKTIIETRNPTVIELKRPIPVHVTYLTAWAERDGTVHFRSDVYRRDEAVRLALREALRSKR